MVDTITIQVNFDFWQNKKYLRKIKSGEITYLEQSAYNRGEKRKDLCFVGGVEPCGLFYNANLHYLCITFNPKNFIGHYATSADSEVIMKSISDFINNDLKISTNDIKSINLNRIDYNNDFRVNSEEEKEIIYNLMSKTPEKLGKVVKTKFEKAISYAPKHRLRSSNFI